MIPAAIMPIFVFQMFIQTHNFLFRDIPMFFVILGLVYFATKYFTGIDPYTNIITTAFISSIAYFIVKNSNYLYRITSNSIGGAVGIALGVILIYIGYHML